MALVERNDDNLAEPSRPVLIAVADVFLTRRRSDLHPRGGPGDRALVVPSS